MKNRVSFGGIYEAPDLFAGFNAALLRSASNNDAFAGGQADELEEIGPFAVMQAVNEGDFEQAFMRIKKIRDPRLRSSLNAMARARAIRAALGKGDFETADLQAKEILHPAQRVALLVEMAQALLVKQHNAPALEVLTEAESLAQRIENGVDKSQALLLVAGAMAQVDPPRGFSAMSAAIEALNQAEKTVSSPHRVALIFDVSKLEPAFAALAGADFERAWQLAQTIQSPETAFVIQLALCQSLLTHLPKPHSEASGHADEPSGK